MTNQKIREDEDKAVAWIKSGISNELESLKPRIARLESDIKIPDEFGGMYVRYQNLMKRQLVAMREYADMLEARLAAVEELRSV